MKLAYIDSCIWITAIEGLPAYQTVLDGHLRDLAQDGWTFCVSDLVILEVLTKPLKENHHTLLQRYRTLLGTLRPLKTYINVFKDALSISSSEALKGLDALHVTLASHHNCQLFVSSDPHFRRLKIMAPYWIDLQGKSAIKGTP
jgi:predicted nucleic acid-binding protein